ncbi:MAG TPA: YjbH domain-containing protein [Syntrophales bacterium]|nr:YjbH domain-containing protein [Syntrophales bacterium]
MGLFILTLCAAAQAADEPFTGPANWGGTGLMETPTARVLKENRYRVGVTFINPYRHYYGAVSPFKGLEIDGRFTEIIDVPVNPGSAYWSGYGNYKDKVADIKYRFLPETKYLPALAVGIMDPHGTRLYASQYIVANKQLFPFDFSIGFGNGRYGRNPLAASGEEVKVEMITKPREWLSEGLLFGGVQFAAAKWLILMAEYSPIRYEQQKDPARDRYFRTAPPSKFNFGARLRPWDWLEATVSYQRGEQVGVNLSMAFDLGVPLIPLYDQPYREKKELRHHPLKERVVTALSESGFSDIVVVIDEGELDVEAHNDKYYYTPRAIGAALRALASILEKEVTKEDLEAAPAGGTLKIAGVEKVRLTLTERGIPLVRFTTTAQDVVQYYGERFTLKEFLSLAKMETATRDNLPGRKENRNWWDWGLKPSFETFINDPSGFFKYRLGAEGWVNLYPWRGASVTAGIAGYPINDVSSVNAPMPQAVRSDLWLYTKEKANLGVLMFEQMEKFPYEIYGRVSGGYLEVQYGGFDAEVARPFWGGRLLLGLGGSYVKKRKPDSLLAFKEEDYKSWYTTGFVNARINIPEIEGSIDIKTGRFLAGDKGTVISVSKFINGVILRVWYSFTDTSMFTDQHNNGYHDKGISIAIPFRLFKGSDSRTSYYFGFSPWTRDVAQDVDHFTSLFNHIQRNTKLYLDKDIRTRGSGLEN